MRKSRPKSIKSKDGSGYLHKLYWILGILCAITLFIIFFVIGDYGLYQIYLLNKQKEQIENHLVELQYTQDSLLIEKTRLESDLQYIEKLAREKYRMAKKGEKVFRVIEKPVERLN
ncbi:MAG: septum formation initiator family protein [Candidatus Marinimicrobia bacterium]|jgi:cell division protein FtsB|nr:septum formation initiator family protein [Candidatus Neomarinimicrobiota bacterium]OQC48347.1 MAG: Cell division protein FtsL [Candidatus Marinimicrobia bacterium ADurb.Bin030]MBP9005477.1 septum formation initiator family protein [Candidatus Neomarinimicrobiota bacterium]NLA22765.1 septum formation initiator family protein [Candidatus Neomarinimicrobiota bacterium]HNZ36504.1 septum formation initiator family protein [Candidatus Neomarinimicrobiota bacterium]